MTQLAPLDIVGGYGKSEFPEFNPEETINMYVETKDDGTKALFPTPGLEQIKKVFVEGGGRALYQFGDIFFAVIKDVVFKIDSSLNPSSTGSLDTEEGHVGISDNGSEVIFVDGVGGWIWDLATENFIQITDPGFPTAPQSATVLGGRFIVNFGDSEKMGFSDINDGTSWPALNFFSMEPYPDKVVGLSTLNGRLFVMGKKSTITYYLSGNANLPYTKDAPAHEFGASSIGAIEQGLGVLCWLSKTENGVSSVLLTTGGDPISVSTEAIDAEFESYTDVSDATSYIYKNENGNVFYVINFTSENKSWQFHINSKLPLEERWSRLTYKKDDRNLSNAHTYFNGKHYTLGHNDGNLYELSSNFHDDNGVNILRRRITKNLKPKNLDRFSVGRIIFDLKQGTGLETTDDNDDNPVLFLSVSKDGGISYGNVLTDEIGKIGRRDWRTEFFRLGYFEKGMVLKIEHYNKTPILIMGASIFLRSA